MHPPLPQHDPPGGTLSPPEARHTPNRGRAPREPVPWQPEPLPGTGQCLGEMGGHAGEPRGPHLPGGMDSRGASP